MLRSRRNLIVSSIALAIGGLSTPASAQDAAEEEKDNWSDAAIVVTAQKREQSIQDVPLSITAFTQEALEKRNISDVNELTTAVPGFNFTRGKFENPVYRLRGVGYFETSAGAPPAVSIYTDEIPLPFPVMSKGVFLDVARVEVLKGPQGTLYGQNATGGLVNFVSALPGQDTEIGGSVSANSFGEISLTGFGSTQTKGGIGIRTAFKAVRGGAWQRSITRDDTLGDRNFNQAKLIVTAPLGDAGSARLFLNAWRDRSENQAAQLVAIPIGNPRAPANIVAAIRALPIALGARDADWDPGTDFRADQRFVQVGGHIDLDLSDSLQLVSNTAYSWFRQNEKRDIDGAAISNLLLLQDVEIGAFFQELRLQGEAGPLQWIIGGNYAHDKPFELASPLYPQSTVAYTFAAFGAPPFTGAASEGNQVIETWSGFANADVEITDQFKFSGGIRYTSSKNHFTGCTRDIDGTGADGFNRLAALLKGAGNFIPSVTGGCLTRGTDLNPAFADLNLNEDNVSWRGSLSWVPNRDVHLYASVAKGYKAGSFSNLTASSILQYAPAKQESILAYELGAKLSLAGGRVQMNGAAFYYDYRDKQTLASLADPLGVFPVLPTLINIPKSVIKGIEVDLVVTPAPGLRLNGGATYLATRIDGNFTIFNGRNTTFNWDGLQLPDTPDWSADFGAEYSFAASSDFDVQLGLTYSYKAANISLLSASLTSGSTNPQFSQFGARVALVDADERWSLTAWARNLFNQKFWSSTFTQADVTTRFMEKPRSFGLTLSGKF